MQKIRYSIIQSFNYSVIQSFNYSVIQLFNKNHYLCLLKIFLNIIEMKNQLLKLMPFLCVLLSFQVIDAQTWEKKNAPIMTIWGENIDPNNVLNAYPRPQMERSDWVNLNGVWDFVRSTVSAFGQYNASLAYDKKILVPFPVESALSGIMDTDFTNTAKTYIYKRKFTIPDQMKGKQILLHFEAVDWRSVVFVNGEKMGMHEGGYDPFYYNITGALKGDGEQELVVHTYDPTDNGQPGGKQSKAPGGISYTPSSGIWQTVWLEAVENIHINDFTIVSDVDHNCVKIKVLAQNSDASVKVDIDVLDGIQKIATQTAEIGKEISIPISNPKLWSPDSPFLYNLKFTLKQNGSVKDEVNSYFGMRKISVEKLRGNPFIFLNNKAIFQFGPLDQGFWPDGLYTPPSDEALKFDVEKMKELGFNMVRKHIKIEPARWYYYCDLLGLLVWQDMPNPGTSGILGDGKWIRQNFLRETEMHIKNLKNHPSIIVWVPFNESWGQFDTTSDHTKDGVNTIRSIDSTRLINPASGWTNFELGDIIDKHAYTHPNLWDNSYNLRANVCGETGGFGLLIEGHIWNKGDNPYGMLNSSTALINNIESMNKDAFLLTANALCGLVYTQLSDVEGEVNGFYTYDRKVSKLNETQKATFKLSINRLQTKALYMVMPSGLQITNSTWKYTTGARTLNPGTNWNSDFDFDDSSWKEGVAGFGASANYQYHRMRTDWSNGSIFLRKKVVMPQMTAQELEKLQLFISHDEDVQVYINGILAASATGYIDNYKTMDISKAAKTAIKLGEENLIAVKCLQSTGGQYIDVGFVMEVAIDEDVELSASNNKIFKEISTPEQFNDIRNNLSGFYKLTANIDLSGYKNFEPIGTKDNPFTGYLNGNGFAVKNLKVSYPTTVNADANKVKGLFAFAKDAYITDLELFFPQVSGRAEIGALVGSGDGLTIERVVLTRPVVYAFEYVGGFIGSVTAGFNNVTKINDCYISMGDVKADSRNAGGIIGGARYASLKNVYFTGDVESTSKSTAANSGGILGISENNWNVFNGVVSLAENVIGGVASQFIPRTYSAIQMKDSYARSDMFLSAYTSSTTTGLGRAMADQIKDPAVLKTQTFYESIGWDFDKVWKMPENGFPVFKNKTFSNNDQISVTERQKNLNVYKLLDQLVFNVTDPASVWIYDVSGALIKRFEIQDEMNIALPQGVYVVKSVSKNGVESIKVEE